jgi:hypothetical protein
LKAQNIPGDKSVKGARAASAAADSAQISECLISGWRACLRWLLWTVLQDVVRAMFTRDFIAELFKPQELYSSASARQIFDKLAHSSIMRLSTSSMNKVRKTLSSDSRRPRCGWRRS